MDELETLLRSGLSASEALDYWATTKKGYSQSEWADIRGKSRQAVNKNVKNAERKLLE
ncbi:hypothetical protein SAMN05421858_5073 [Haladaptatus litoreus]|uniref:Uncharacterized protein n=1 Tax=Haladaptatus litoreus TaxID=553468 RepID=A0A1N7FHS0_9EURY|nr:hypothetical protein SAMN05421858_5073 [Haladaptatus litoreus]